MDFDHSLEKYAELTVQVAVNLQPGQELWIQAPIHSPELVRLISRKAYGKGASQVHIEWVDETSTKLMYELAPEEGLGKFPRWKAQAYEEIAEKNGAFLFIQSSDPELLCSVDPRRIALRSKAAGEALKKWEDYEVSYKMTWSIIAVPSLAWARKVYPELEPEDAVNSLWQAIFRAVRIDRPDPVQAWHHHNESLRKQREQLTAKQYSRLHYRAPGTELTVELPGSHIWRGGAADNEQGHAFNPNVPTEEVFVTPHQAGTNGVVRSTKPLSYRGSLINNFTLRFEQGRVVDFEAEEGYEALKNMLDMDEGARYLGEIALVPHSSPISSEDLIFYNTLFDENASCHLALGRGFTSSLEYGRLLSNEQLAAAGINQSLIHVDFMIGSASMDIDGETQDGRIEPIFRNGGWALNEE
ncbi:aminopeptidase [Paenibacillus medicaginis]|uniref:Aminopeptidase n=1 Tax=Paenibacillus medicaginis TaxID=1470560 RepID=A0ABV5C3C2_9BACL